MKISEGEGLGGSINLVAPDVATKHDVCSFLHTVQKIYLLFACNTFEPI